MQADSSPQVHPRVASLCNTILCTTSLLGDGWIQLEALAKVLELERASHLLTEPLLVLVAKLPFAVVGSLPGGQLAARLSSHLAPASTGLDRGAPSDAEVCEVASGVLSRWPGEWVLADIVSSEARLGLKARGYSQESVGGHKLHLSRALSTASNVQRGNYERLQKFVYRIATNSSSSSAAHNDGALITVADDETVITSPGQRRGLSSSSASGNKRARKSDDSGNSNRSRSGTSSVALDDDLPQISGDELLGTCLAVLSKWPGEWVLADVVSNHVRLELATRGYPPEYYTGNKLPLRELLTSNPQL